MAHPPWEVSGDYFETCSCTYLCPCLPSNLAAPPTKGTCTGAFAFHVDRGHYGSVKLDGLNFAVVFQSPGVMGEGNWAVGVVAEDRATSDQRDAIVAIASGQAGGPMGALAPLVGRLLGVESKPIRFEKRGLTRRVSIPGVLELEMEGTPSPVKEGEPLYVDNTLHPANARLALGRGTRNLLHVFGLGWDDASGQNNGHFAPFSWRG